MDDEVDEEEVKLWDTRCTGGSGLGTLHRWFRNEGGAMEDYSGQSFEVVSYLITFSCN